MRNMTEKAAGWKVLGHETIKRLLGLQLHNRIFSHAYLFLGPEGIGKKTLALEFAGKLLASPQPTAHPDFLFFEPEGDISISDVRLLCSKLASKPFVAGRKIAILNNIERLNTQAANALLKTLEEPAASTIIILIAGAVTFPKTLTSRCQVLHFGVLPRSALLMLAAAFGLKPTAQLLNLSGGSFGRLLALSDADTNQLALLERMKSALRGSRAEKLLATMSLGQYEPGQIRPIFELLKQELRGGLSARPEAYAIIRAANLALEELDGHMNKKLVLEKFFLQTI